MRTLSRRIVRSLPWVLLALALGFTAGAIVFALKSNPYRGPGEDLRPLDLLWGSSFMSFPVVGAVVASRRPQNPIGWILCGIGASLGFGLFTSDYATFASVVPGAGGPADHFIAWLSIWAFQAMFVLSAFLLLLFPDGHLPGRRWRWLARAVVVIGVLGTTAEALRPGPMGDGIGLMNPFGVDPLGDVLASIASVGVAGLTVGLLIAATAPIVRFVRSRGEQRLQLKWFAFAAALLLAQVLVDVGLRALGVILDETLGTAMFIVSVYGVSVAMGVSILKYRLYEIDRIVNRTIVYAVLTAVLAAVYLGIVFVLQGVVAGVGAGSDLVVAASTLAVAALFSPLRRRVQAFIDHYFYRRKYDAAKTVEEFSSRLRQQVDLDSLHRELTAVVRKTMQPAHVSLWLRSEAQ